MSRVLGWTFGPGDPRQLAALRIGLCAVLVLRLATRTDVYLSLAEQEPELYRPLSFMALAHQMPPRAVIAALLAVAIVAALAERFGAELRA